MSEERPCGIFQKCPKCACDCKVCDKCGKFTCDKCDDVWDDSWKVSPKKHFPKCPKCPECGCDCKPCEKCHKFCCCKCDFGCDCKKHDKKCHECGWDWKDEDSCDDSCDDSWKYHKKHFPKCPKCECCCLICKICAKFTCEKCDFGCDCKKHGKKYDDYDRNGDYCPVCGKPHYEDFCDEKPKKKFKKDFCDEDDKKDFCDEDDKKDHFPKSHVDFAKCNLCNCITRDDNVTLGTNGGTVVVGTVAELLCDCTVLRLAPGAIIIPPGDTSPLVTTQPSFVCCDDIQWIVKQALIALNG